MGLEAAVFAALTGAPALTALVASRVFPDVLPQEVEMPALRVTVISDVPESSLNGAQASALANARVQVDAYAKTREQSREVAEAVKAAMDLKSAKAGGFDCWFASSGNLFDDATQDYRIRMDFNVWR